VTRNVTIKSTEESTNTSRKFTTHDKMTRVWTLVENYAVYAI